MYDDARKYLEKVVPWDGTNWINIHQMKTYGHGGRSIPGRPARTVQAALGLIKKMPHLDDVYLSMGAAKEMEMKKGPHGEFAIALRHRDNVYGLKALYADLDVKPGAYASTDDALKALLIFTKAISLPFPNVLVESGTGGVHAYWTLDQVLSTEDWQPRANALSAALIAHGVHCDTGCTVDNVRLLRIPDTFNAKRDPHLPVKLKICRDWDYSLDEIDAALMPYFGLPTSTPKGNGTGEPDINDELSGGIVAAKAAKRRADDLAAVCPAFANTLASNGRDDNNPRWHLMLTLAYYCEEGEELAHQLSSAHPGYHHEETQVEFDRIKKDRDERPSLGWTKCATFASNGCAECQSCPLLKAGQSPLNHAKPPASAVMDDFPAPFFRAKDTGFVYVRGKDGEPDELACRYNIFDAWISRDGWRLHFKFNTVGAGTQDCALPFDALASDQVFVKTLNGQGFLVMSKWTKPFMQSFMAQLQEQKDKIATSQAFGWYREPGELEGFIYAGQRFTAAGAKKAAKPSEALYSKYTPKGAIDPWLELARIINYDNRPDLDMFIAGAFAAPLVVFTEHEGFTLGGWSSASGIGKTTAMRVATSVWGHPKNALMGLEDTQNALAYTLGQIRNLPIAWDEFRGKDQEAKFAKLLFHITGGREKYRSSRSGEAKTPGQWNTLLMYATNASMVDAVLEENRTSPAGYFRMFEVNVLKREEVMRNDRVGELQTALRDNYGWAGLRYAQFLGANIERVKHDIAVLKAGLNKHLQTAEEQRYWVAAVVCLLLGAKYANELGLTEINFPQFRDYLFSEFRRMADNKRTLANDIENVANVVAILGDFLREKRAHNTVRTDRIWLGRGKPGKDAVRITNEGNAVDMKAEAIQVQIAEEQRIIRIAERPFSDWLRHKGYHVPAFKEAMERTLGARRLSGAVLAGGTRLSTGFKEQLYELSVPGTELEKHVDWEDDNGI